MRFSKLSDVIIPLFFFPVYFTVSGIYKIASPGRGLILPLTVALGFYSTLRITINHLRLSKVKIASRLLQMIIILVYLIIIHTLIGYALFYNTSSVLINLQYLSGLLGVYISVYLIKYKKMEVGQLFYKISVVFLFAIISNIALSIYKVGVVQTFSRYIFPSTPFGGIYHIFIYYPFIVSIVFLFALPLWQKKKGPFILVYLLVTIYIMVLQVRGAILSYFLGLIVYILRFSKRNKIFSILMATMFALFILFIFPKDVLFGRFMSTDVSIISGRENVWKRYLENLVGDPLYIVKGSFSKASTPDLLAGDPFGKGLGHSYHNQYIEILDSYGIVIFALFLIILFYYLFTCLRQVEYFKLNNVYYYWLSLVAIHFMVDLNVNVPLRVTNPAIFYLFYWASLYLSIQNMKCGNATHEGLSMGVLTEARTENE